MHVAPTKEELERRGMKLGKELETHQESGMVEATGEEGRHKDQHRGIEQKYIEEDDVFNVEVW